MTPSELTRKITTAVYHAQSRWPSGTPYQACTVDDLAEASIYAQQNDIPTTILGGGSNILPSDQGVPGSGSSTNQGHRIKRMEW
ncbi:MAG: hypothetical protein R2688_07265 [Fimbriimonadaceae bacterium]